MLVLMGTHLALLHEFGSFNPLGVDSRGIMVPFFPYYFYSDLLGVILGVRVLSYLVFLDPYLLSDPLNYEEANPMVTPLHIKPEWYFLAYYALLRRVPRKRGGIVVIVIAIFIIVLIPLCRDKLMLGVQNYIGRSTLFWLQINCWLILTWLGAQPAEEPFIIIRGAIGLLLVVLGDLEQLVCD